MGAFLGALLGQHLARVEDAREQTRDWILAPIKDRQANPTSPHYTNEQLDDAVKAGYAHGYLDKHKKPIIDAQFKEMKRVWDEARDKEVQGQALSAVQSNQPQDKGRPLMNAGATPPVAAVGPQPQLPPPPAIGSPDAIRAAATGGAPQPSPSGGFDSSAIMQRLLPLFMAAKAQQAGGGMQGAMQGAPAGGMPQQGAPNFSGGSGDSATPGPVAPKPVTPSPVTSGPSASMQPGENPIMAKAAVTGGEGFGTPPPAAAPAKSSLPKPPYYADTFGGGGMDPDEYAARQGRTTATTARPTLEMQSDVARQQLAPDYAAREKLYGDKPWFKSLPEIFQAQLLSGQTIPGAAAHFSIPGTTKSLPGDVDLNGDPVAPDTPHVKRTYINGKWIAQVQEVRGVVKDVLAADGSIKRIGVDPYTFKASEPIEGLTSAAIVKELPVTHADGTVTRVGVTRTGIVVSSDARLNGFSIAAFPRETSGLKVRDDGDGSFSLVPVTTFSGPILQKDAGQAMPQTGVGATIPSATPAAGTPAATAPVGGATPAATPPYPPGPAMGNTASAAPRAATRTGIPAARVSGAAIPFGSRSIPPGQRITFETKDSAFVNTIDLIKSVQDKLPLLNSIINAGKLEFALAPDPADPLKKILTTVVKRNMPLSNEEERLVADVESLKEHINTLRGPLGAAGFRGPEAFAALQEQRGNLLTRPGITKGLLENTMKALQGQHNALRQGLDKGKPIPQSLVDMLTPAPAIQNPPAGTPTHSVPELGSTFNGGKVLKVTPIK